MSAVELHQRIAAETKHVRQALSDCMRDKSLSSITHRMQRAALVANLYSECGKLAQLCLVKGGDFTNPHVIAETTLSNLVAEFYRTFGLGGTTAEVAQQYKQLRRIIVEAKTMFQGLTMYHGKTYIEDTILKLVASTIAKLESFAFQQIIVASGFGGLTQYRTALRKGDKVGADKAKDDVKSCFLFALDLLPPTDRKRLLPQLLRVPYIQAVLEQLKDSIMMEDVDTFLDDVSRTLDIEYQLAADVMPEDLAAPEAVKLRLQEYFLCSKSMDIIHDTNSGVASTLVFPNLKADRFRVLLNVFDFSQDVVQQFKNALAESVQKTRASADDVMTLAKTYAAYSAFVVKGTQAAHTQVFLRVLNTTISSAVDHSVLAVNLADAFNDVITHVKKKAPLDASSKDIDSLALVVPLCRHVSLFADHYKQRLLQRLCCQRHPSVTAEEYTLRKIAAHCPVPPVVHAQRLLHETVHSKPHEKATLCNSLLCPPVFEEFKQERLLQPLQSSLSEVVRQVQQAAPSLSLSPDVWLSTAEIRVSVSSGAHCRVFGVLAQLQLLVYLFTVAEEPVTIARLSDAVAMTSMTAFCVLSSLESAGLVSYSDKLVRPNVDFITANVGAKIALPCIPIAPRDVVAVPRLPEVEPTVSAAKAKLLCDQASELRVKGNKLFAEGKNREALAAYEASYKALADVLPSPYCTSDVVSSADSTRSNIVLVLIKVGRNKDAKELASELLSAGTLSDQLTKKIRYRRALALVELADLNAAEKELLEIKEKWRDWDKQVEEKLVEIRGMQRGAQQRKK